MWWPWVDPAGTVHIRKPRTGETYCGRVVGPVTSVTATGACDRCVHLDAVEAQSRR